MPEHKIAQLTGAFGSAAPVLIAELARLGYVPGEVAPALSVVLVRGARDERALLAVSGATTPVVAVLAGDDPAAARAVAMAGARGLLDLPLRRSAIGAQVALAVAASAHHRRLENKAALLERTLRNRRTIENATQLLAQTRGIDEAEAYEVLRKAAMSGRVTMVEVAVEYLSASASKAAE